MSEVLHDSDCALHNAPALPVGPCNCSVSRYKYIDTVHQMYQKAPSWDAILDAAMKNSGGIKRKKK